MTTQVYIITKEGRVYTVEGTDYVRTQLNKKFGVNPDDIECNMGQWFNKPELLANRLQKHENAYVVISTPDDIIFCPQDLNKEIIDVLNEHPEKSSWETLMICCGRKT